MKRYCVNVIYSWSFGIVLWEIVTFGTPPYPGVRATDLSEFLKDRNIMPQPERCPNEFYELMRMCWFYDPDQRPTFQALVEQIKYIMRCKTKVNSFVQLPNSPIRIVILYFT